MADFYQDPHLQALAQLKLQSQVLRHPDIATMETQELRILREQLGNAMEHCSPGRPQVSGWKIGNNTTYLMERLDVVEYELRCRESICSAEEGVEHE